MAGPLGSANNVLAAYNAPAPTGWSYHIASTGAQSDVTIAAAAGAGLYNYISSVVISNGSANALTVLIEDSTTTGILGPYYLPATIGTNLVIFFPVPKKQTNANTLISVTTTQSVSVVYTLDVVGFTGL